MKESELEGEFKELAIEQEKREEEILDLPNVVGVGVGTRIKEHEGDIDTKKACLSVFVSQKLDKDDLQPKERIDEAFDVLTTGEIFAGATHAPAPPATRKAPQGRAATRFDGFIEPRGDLGLAPSQIMVTEPEEEAFEQIDIQVLGTRIRPVEGGYSVGHYRGGTGTMATAVYDARPFPGVPRTYYILSNNHVLALSNMARIGDPILQPGLADGGQFPPDIIARLSRFVPIFFGGASNTVDAAIAQAEFHDIDREIYWIGYLKGVRTLTTIGEVVQKTGRTTNYTTGRVVALNATVNINYGGGRIARFVRQIVTTNMSSPGDSGSCLCDMNGNAVGLLFAGSSRVTIHNHMNVVQGRLGIRVV